jgi:hypothetical protein
LETEFDEMVSMLYRRRAGRTGSADRHAISSSTKQHREIRGHRGSHDSLERITAELFVKMEKAVALLECIQHISRIANDNTRAFILDITLLKHGIRDGLPNRINPNIRSLPHWAQVFFGDLWERKIF